MYFLFKGFTAAGTANLVFAVYPFYTELGFAVGTLYINMGFEFLDFVFVEYKKIAYFSPYRKKFSVFGSSFIDVFRKKSKKKESKKQKLKQINNKTAGKYIDK